MVQEFQMTEVIVCPQRCEISICEINSNAWHPSASVNYLTVFGKVDTLTFNRVRRYWTEYHDEYQGLDFDMSQILVCGMNI